MRVLPVNDVGGQTLQSRQADQTRRPLWGFSWRSNALPCKLMKQHFFFYFTVGAVLCCIHKGVSHVSSVLMSVADQEIPIRASVHPHFRSSCTKTSVSYDQQSHTDPPQMPHNGLQVSLKNTEGEIAKKNSSVYSHILTTWWSILIAPLTFKVTTTTWQICLLFSSAIST